ncbi:MAG: glycosyltransferase [Planctomycetota bacterium]|nr:glycosyltransferase [Planctomycetota bacterium]
MSTTPARTAPAISAVVVVRNEADKLDACLASLAWCDELIVIDLESTDASAAVASRHTTRVLTHPLSPIVEPVRCFAAQRARNDWLLFVDPDERVPTTLVADLHRAIADHPRAGIVRLPWQFFFKGERLDGTVWGGPNRSKRFLVHRRRTALSPLVHAGSRTLEGFDEVTVAPAGGNHVQHFWMDSYAGLIEKHWRYAREEGKARHEAGKRFSLHGLLVEPIVDTYRCFRDYDGHRLGFRGAALSLLYGAIRAAGEASLLAYQMRRGSTARPASAPPASIPAQPAATHEAGFASPATDSNAAMGHTSFPNPLAFVGGGEPPAEAFRRAA